MIRLHLNGNPIANHLILHDIDVTACLYNIEGKEPARVIEALVTIDWDWTLEISEDEPDTELARRWEIADVVGRLTRAFTRGKTILLETDTEEHDVDIRLTSMDHAVTELGEFVVDHGFVPFVVEDNSERLKLGFTPDTAGMGENTN